MPYHLNALDELARCLAHGVDTPLAEVPTAVLEDIWRDLGVHDPDGTVDNIQIDGSACGAIEVTPDSVRDELARRGRPAGAVH